MIGFFWILKFARSAWVRFRYNFLPLPRLLTILANNVIVVFLCHVIALRNFHWWEEAFLQLFLWRISCQGFRDRARVNLFRSFLRNWTFSRMKLYDRVRFVLQGLIVWLHGSLFYFFDLYFGFDFLLWNLFLCLYFFELSII